MRGRGRVLSLLNKINSRPSPEPKPKPDEPLTYKPDASPHNQQRQPSPPRTKPQPPYATVIHESEEDEDMALWDLWDPMGDDYKSTNNTLALDPTRDPECQITGKVLPISSKIGNVIICDHYAKYGECADGDYCSRIHISPKAREKVWELQNTYESNKNRVCLNSTYLSPVDFEPNTNVRLLVSVTSARTPNDMYIVAPYENMNFINYTNDDIEFYISRVEQTSSVKTKLERCHEQLAQLFDHHYRIDNVNDAIYLSQVVACKLKDGRFRRAMVVETPSVHEKSDYKLLLIDVGVEVELPRESIYDIKAKCLSEPPMALNVRFNVKLPQGHSKWPKESLDQFKARVRGERFLLCQVIDYNDADKLFTVDLYHCSNRKSITEELVNAGIADTY